jgi:hypothetical protein
MNARNIDPGFDKAIKIDDAKIVIANGQDKTDGPAELRSLVGKDRRSAGWERDGQRLRRAETVSDRVGHELN